MKDLRLQPNTIIESGQTDEYYAERVVSVSLTSEGALEVVKRQRVNHLMLGVLPDKVWKEVYVGCDNKVILGQIIEGRHIPAQPERIEFDETE